VTYAGNAGTYNVADVLAITCTAADNLSGLASTTCADITGPATAFPPGVHTVFASATDNAGNVGSGSTTFTVAVTFDGLCALRAFINLVNAQSGKVLSQADAAVLAALAQGLM